MPSFRSELKIFVVQNNIDNEKIDESTPISSSLFKSNFKKFFNNFLFFKLTKIKCQKTQ